MIRSSAAASRDWPGVIFDGGLALLVLRLAVERNAPLRDEAIVVMGTLAVDPDCGEAFRDLLRHLLMKKFDKSLLECHEVCSR